MPRLEQNPNIEISPEIYYPDFVPSFLAMAKVVRLYSWEDLNIADIDESIQTITDCLPAGGARIAVSSALGLYQAFNTKERDAAETEDVGDEGVPVGELYDIDGYASVQGFMASPERVLVEKRRSASGLMADLYLGAYTRISGTSGLIRMWLPSAHITRLEFVRFKGPYTN